MFHRKKKCSLKIHPSFVRDQRRGWNCLIVQLTWGLGGWGCWTGCGGGSSFFLFPALSYSWSFLITRGESVSRKMPESGPRAASSVSRTRSRSPDDSWGVDVNRTVDLESPSESSPSRCRMNRLLYLDLFLGTSYSGASYLSYHDNHFYSCFVVFSFFFFFTFLFFRNIGRERFFKQTNKFLFARINFGERGRIKEDGDDPISFFSPDNNFARTESISIERCNLTI